MKRTERIAVVLIALIVAVGIAGQAWAGYKRMVDQGRMALYFMSSASVPITAVGNYPGDDGYCPPEGGFDMSMTQLYTSGTADITVTAQHGVKDIDGTIGWQNATNAHTVNGTTALINSTHKFTAVNEGGECYRLNVSAGVDAVGNSITNATVWMENQ